MVVRVLGCSGGWPGPARACSGYLVTEGSARVLVDAGAGTLARLLEHGAAGRPGRRLDHPPPPGPFSDLGLLRNLLAYGRGRGG